MKNLNKSVYMIRRKSDGKFSTGRSHPSFTTNGKAWTNIGHLKNHLNMLIEYGQLNLHDIYKDCEIVVLSVKLEESSVIPIAGVIDESIETYKSNHSWRKLS